MKKEVKKSCELEVVKGKLTNSWKGLLGYAFEAFLVIAFVSAVVIIDSTSYYDVNDVFMMIGLAAVFMMPIKICGYIARIIALQGVCNKAVEQPEEE